MSNSKSLTEQANNSAASLIEEERIVPKLLVKTLTDRSIKIDYTNSSLSLFGLKELLQEKVELSPERQFFVLNGVVYGRDAATDSILINQLPGFKTPEAILAEFQACEEKRRKDSEGSTTNDDDSSAKNTISIVKGIEDLLPPLYLFHYEPAAKAMDPLEIASDWDQKNRLKFFKGIWAVAERDFSQAAKFLVDALPTFEETACLPYRDLVKYAVITAAIAFDRPSLKSKIIRSPEVLECIKSVAHLENFINSLYNCRYGEFFQALAALEPALKADWLLAPHTSFIMKEMRIRAYAQMLESYRSLSLNVMAQAFGVSVDYMDSELSRFIAAGRLNCVIDKVNGVVLTNKADLRTEQYLAVLKSGDQVVSKMQKLGRVITY